MDIGMDKGINMNKNLEMNMNMHKNMDMDPDMVLATDTDTDTGMVKDAAVERGHRHTVDEPTLSIDLELLPLSSLRSLELCS